MLQDKLELAILAIVAFSVLPVLVEYLRHRRQANAVVTEVVEDITEEI